MLHDGKPQGGGCFPVDIIAALAVLHPDSVALRQRDQQLTYGGLISAADQLADAMMDARIGADQPVGICLDRSFDYVVAMVAAARAGGAFMPLDPTWPTDRIRFALADARASVLVTSSKYRASLGGGTWTTLSPDELELAQSTQTHHPRVSPQPSALAYLIYTSGSTGTPKGVEIPHSSLASLIEWHNEAFGVTERDRASCVAGLGFDAAIWEIWPYLCAGACVSLCDETSRTSADSLRDWLVSEQISIAFVPTPLAERMITSAWPKDTALRAMLTGGDVLHVRPIP